MPFPIENIQDLCDEYGETFKSLEKKLGFGNSTIKRWGDAKKLPPYIRVKMVADFFHVSVHELSNGLYDDIQSEDNIKTATIGDGISNDAVVSAKLSYANSMLLKMTPEVQNEAITLLQSLLQRQSTQDAQKESD